MKKYILLFILSLSILNINAQADETDALMFWHSIGMSSPMGEKMKFKLSLLNSLRMDRGEYNFLQPKVGFAFDVGRRQNIELGFKPIISLTRDQMFNPRFYIAYNRSVKLNTFFRMTNELTFEHNTQEYGKFKQRIYYDMGFYYRNLNLPLKLRPYTQMSLYYYLNGRPLQYYDNEGIPTEELKPNGLHALRYNLGVKIYPTNVISMSFNYKGQREFNIGNKRNINSLNPNTGSIRRDFYHFNVVGVSIFFSLSKKKDKKKVKS